MGNVVVAPVDGETDGVECYHRHGDGDDGDDDAEVDGGDDDDR